MLKQLASLLCSLFVPRKSVSGGGSYEIYGLNADRFSLPIWSNPVVISLPDSEAGNQNYTAPYPCMVSLVVRRGYPNDASSTYALINIASVYVTLVRSSQYNVSCYCFLKKGDMINFGWRGADVKAYVYKLVLPSN